MQAFQAAGTVVRLLCALIMMLPAAALPQVAHAQARTDPVAVYVFWREGCPHCARAIAFLERVARDDPALQVRPLEVARDPANTRLMLATAHRLGVESGSVPLTVIGTRAWVGYLDDASTGAEFLAAIRACREAACPDTVAALQVAAQSGAKPPPAREPVGERPVARLPGTVQVPLIGEVRTAQLSLPVLTVTLAAVDGFNPCAMWVLLFLLGLLTGMQDRTRMWVLGGAFVASSALVYLLVLAAWLNVLLFVGAIVWVRIAVGVIALGAGGYYLRQFTTGAAGVCEVSAPQSRRRVLERLKDLAQQRDFLIALGGIVLLAFAVNLIEFLCSAGIPAVFTQLLALSDLPAWLYMAYLLLYVVVFMLDDLIVLVVALKTLEVSGLTTTYARWSNLIGGVVLLGIGVALVFRPQWLGAS